MTLFAEAAGIYKSFADVDHYSDLPDADTVQGKLYVVRQPNGNPDGWYESKFNGSEWVWESVNSFLIAEIAALKSAVASLSSGGSGSSVATMTSSGTIVADHTFLSGAFTATLAADPVGTIRQTTNEGDGLITLSGDFVGEATFELLSGMSMKWHKRPQGWLPIT